MKTYNDDEVTKKMASLPADVRALIFDDSVGLKLRAIGTKYGLLLDQVTRLMAKTRLVLFGVISNDEFIDELEAEFKIPGATASAIAQDISEGITAPIIKAMQARQTGTDEDAESIMSDDAIANIIAQSEAEKKEEDLFRAELESTEEPEEIEEPNPATADREALIAKAVRATGTADAKPTATQAATDEIQRGLTGEKLAGSFKIPGEEKDYSVNKPSEQASKQIPVIRHRDRVDPYHEPIE